MTLLMNIPTDSVISGAELSSIVMKYGEMCF
jgi:hypothetical protein